METTETPESFTDMASTVHNELNLSLENLVSAFDTAIYIGKCTGLLYHMLAHQLKFIPHDGVFPQELIRTAWELYGKYNTVVKNSLWFLCTEDIDIGRAVIPKSRIYIHNVTEFMVRLNSSTAAKGEVAVRDTLAELYRNITQKMEALPEIFEHLTEMIPEEAKFYAMKRNIPQQWNSDVFYKSSGLEYTVKSQKELVDLLQNITKRARYISEYKYGGQSYIGFSASGGIGRFFNAQYWANLFEQETKVLVLYKTKLLEGHHMQNLMYKMTPVIVAIALVVGITGNGLLLTIFVRHKETRTLANSMLINLTVVDCVSLVVIGLWEYLLINMDWRFDWFGCKVYVLLFYLLVAVSTYSLAMISVQRFVSVWQLPSLAWYHQSQKTKYVLVATVWGIGFILSVPHSVSAYSENDQCYAASLQNASPLYTADLIMLCVVSLLITAMFSGLTACRIRQSAREIPGEGTGQQQLQHSRMVSSNVLLALTVLYVVSYGPYILSIYLISVVHVSLSSRELISLVITIYYLRFVNCCLNPIVLFVMSKRYRGYINRYCGYIKRYFGQRKATARNKNGRSTETSL
jgi:gastrin-releasing peptide receptor